MQSMASLGRPVFRSPLHAEGGEGQWIYRSGRRGEQSWACMQMARFKSTLHIQCMRPGLQCAACTIYM